MQTSQFELVKCADPDALARTAAASFLDYAGGCATRAEDKGNQELSTRDFTVALAGGRIAGQFFAAVATAGSRAASVLTHARFFWSDERCVPPEHPESNFRLAWERMLLPLAIPVARIHRIKGELPPGQAATVAAEELLQWAPLSAAAVPALDLVLLGMGEEGHIASLFPGEPEAVRRNPALFRAVIASKPPPSRVTMGYGTITAAKQVWVLASGAGKQKALEESLSGTGQTPFAYMLALRNRSGSPADRKTRVFTDLPLRDDGAL